MNLVDELHAVCGALALARIRHAVCGGVAVTIYGATRSTKDIDILIEPDDLDRAMDVVRPLGYRFAALPLVFEEGSPRERRVQRVSKIEDGEHLVVGFLLAGQNFEGFLEGAVRVNLAQGPLTVVSREILIRMKRHAGRTQDLADIEKLGATNGET